MKLRLDQLITIFFVPTFIGFWLNETYASGNIPTPQPDTTTHYLSCQNKIILPENSAQKQEGQFTVDEVNPSRINENFYHNEIKKLGVDVTDLILNELQNGRSILENMLSVLENNSLFYESDSINEIERKITTCTKTRTCSLDSNSSEFLKKLTAVFSHFRLYLAMSQYVMFSDTGLESYQPLYKMISAPYYFKTENLYDPLSSEEIKTFNEFLKIFWEGKTSSITSGFKKNKKRSGGVVDQYILVLTKKMNPNYQNQEELKTLRMLSEYKNINDFQEKVRSFLSIKDTGWILFLNQQFKEFKRNFKLLTWQYFSMFRPIIYLTKSQPTIADLKQALLLAMSDNIQLATEFENKKNIINNSFKTKGAPFDEIDDVLDYSLYLEKYLVVHPRSCQIAETRFRQVEQRERGIVPLYAAAVIVQIMAPISLFTSLIIDSAFIAKNILIPNYQESQKIKSDLNLILVENECEKVGILAKACDDQYNDITRKLTELNLKSMISIFSIGLGIPSSNKLLHRLVPR
ncbi:MAG: hypothetical protein K1X29_02765 [Bdellovibrionales bacterium]|nr:hypothetical protein [Bdellovibrionales bacterium]